MKRLLLAILTALSLSAPVPAAADPSLPLSIEARNGPEKLANPALEARAVALQKQFRCLVCQGESLDESGAPLADDLRRLIRKRILDGQTDHQITQYLVGRYGDFILMNPPFDSQTYVLWLGPVFIFILGAGFAGAVVLRARRRAQDATS